MKKRIVLGISGASGAPVALQALQLIHNDENWESHVIVTKNATETWKHETGLDIEHLNSLSDYMYDVSDLTAAIASGSFKSEGMLIVPCSMKTLSGIASGYSENLLLRTADVNIKEQRKTVLAVRESPLNQIHLMNMLKLAGIGVFICPLVVNYYAQPHSLQDMSLQIAARLLSYFNIECGLYRWGEH